MLLRKGAEVEGVNILEGGGDDDYESSVRNTAQRKGMEGMRQ